MRSMHKSTLRWLYSAGFYLAIPFLFARLYWRGRKEPDYRRRWAERFGFIDAIPPACIWVHAVSLGETRAAVPLIRALQERYPAKSILVTTMTPTGSRQVRDSFGTRVFHVYLPYDLPGAVQRFLRRSRPSLGIIMETELWPNVLHACRAADVPVVIANARLSARSARGYGWIAKLIRPALRSITLIAAQTPTDAERFIALGVDPANIKVTGNIKYDLSLPEGLERRGQDARRTLFGARPVWIAASTHQGEDEIILDAFQSVRETFPELILILVPRHPPRFDGVFQLCQQRSLTTLRRSSGRDFAVKTADVYLGDSIGELLLLYAMADLAFVGGSLVPTGGHNVLEPALLGVPVVFGPHMFNFAEAAQHLLAANGVRQVQNADELAEVIANLLANPSIRQRMGEKARQAVNANRGALARLFALLEDLIRHQQIPFLSEPDKPTARKPSA